MGGKEGRKEGWKGRKEGKIVGGREAEIVTEIV